MSSSGGWGEGIAPLILNLGTRWRTGNYAPRLLYPQEGTHVLTEWEAEWAPEPAWTILLSLACSLSRLLFDWSD